MVTSTYCPQRCTFKKEQYVDLDLSLEAIPMQNTPIGARD